MHEESESLLMPTVTCVAISDTHAQHRDIQVPPGDILLHAGDFCFFSTEEEIKDFDNWLGTLPHKHKIVVGGNHDFLFDEKWCRVPENADFWKSGVGENWGDTENRERIRRLLTNCTYLVDEEVTVEGIRIYATPAQPPLMGHKWAFVVDDDERISEYDKIPDDLDVLLTHCPPYGKGDRSLIGSFGCPYLLDACARKKPRFHVFGHIHDGYGVTQDKWTTFVNASICTSFYHPYHAPIVFKVSKRE